MSFGQEHEAEAHGDQETGGADDFREVIGGERSSEFCTGAYCALDNFVHALERAPCSQSGIRGRPFQLRAAVDVRWR